MISLVLSSEEENSTENGSDLPTLTQGACSTTAKSLPAGLEKRGWTCSTPEASPVVHLEGTSARGSPRLFTTWTARPHEQWGCAAEGGRIVPVCAGVRDGGSLVLPAPPFTWSLPLCSAGGMETFQLKAFKLTVCKLCKPTQIY